MNTSILYGTAMPVDCSVYKYPGLGWIRYFMWTNSIGLGVVLLQFQRMTKWKYKVYINSQNLYKISN